MNSRFRDLRVGSYFVYLETYFCVKTRRKLLCDGNVADAQVQNALLLESRTPTFIGNKEIVEKIDIVVIGTHIWFPALCAEGGGKGPFEIIELYHDNDRDLDYIPVKPGISFKNRRTMVTGVLKGKWDFVCRQELVPLQKEIKVTNPLKAV